MISLTSHDPVHNNDDLFELTDSDNGSNRTPRGTSIDPNQRRKLFRKLKFRSAHVDGANVSPPVQFAVLRAIADRQPTCFISLETLAQESGGFGVATVRRAVKALEDLELIKSEKFATKTYRIVDWTKLEEFAGCQ